MIQWTSLKLQLAAFFAVGVSFYFLFASSLEAGVLLITGCGRSGTTYIARLLQKSGYDIQHERPGTIGSASWPMTVGYYAVDIYANDEPFDHIFHQVRHPLPVIYSWAQTCPDLNLPVWNFIRQHIPEIDPLDSLIVQCAKYWYYWNLLAEQRAEWRYQIEEIETKTSEFIQRSGLFIDPWAFKTTSKQLNGKKKRGNKLSWNDLSKQIPPDLYQNIREMALRYGYK